jgi:ABC-type multidrug transport system fused ATPase/permease subunit
LGGLLWSVAGLLAIQIAGLVLGWWIRIAGLRTNQEVLARLRKQCIRFLYELPRSFHAAADAESLHYLIVQDANWIESMNDSLMGRLLPAILSAIMLFGILFWTQPLLAIVIAVCFPALFIVNRLAVRRIWFLQERLRKASEAFSRGVRFVIMALELTRSQAAEEMELARQSRLTDALHREALDLTRQEAFAQLMQSALILAATLGVLLAGGWAAAGGRISRGELIAFYVVVALFATQARTIVDAVPPVRRGLHAFRELAGLLATPDREPYHGAREVARIDELRLDGVTFAYPGSGAVLQDVSLSVRRGDCVALIGSNGCGKSTLLHLVSGFYRPDSGVLSVDGAPYDELRIQSLRSRMAIVAQNPFLFAGSLRDNVAYGNPNSGDEQVWAAIRAAGGEGFVSELPEKLDTIIGEQGVRLSGGQRQRLVIARALLRRPDLLILDEPTNHLDDAGIAALIESLNRLPDRPGVVIVSHEWRALRYASKAWRLDAGRLTEASLERHA